MFRALAALVLIALALGAGSETRSKTMFVSTLSGGEESPSKRSMRPAMSLASAWSSANLVLLCSRAQSPPAAMRPACRIQPPRRSRTRRARSKKAPPPAMTDPTGAPSPLERQTETESAQAAQSAALTPLATSAFASRAPSK